MGSAFFTTLQQLLPTCADARHTPLPRAQDAAEVLQSVGWWPPHLQLNLVAAGISERFPPELEVRQQLRNAFSHGQLAWLR